MSTNIKYTLLILILTLCQGYGQIEPMPSYELFKPDYQTYRFEKELYSFNLIEYMFEDSRKKIWLSSIHDLKRTNGYQFYNFPQIIAGDKHLKGHIIDGRRWNDSTQYLVEQIDNHALRSHALTTDPPIVLAQLDSAGKSRSKLLFYDVIRNENAYEIWSDSLEMLSLRIFTPDGHQLSEMKIPELDGVLTEFCVTRQQIWLVINNRKIITYQISGDAGLISPSEIQSPANIRIFHSDQFDNIWVSCWDGIYQIRKYDSVYELNPVLPLRNLRQIFEDDFGNLILGTVSFPSNITNAYLYLREGGRWVTLESLIDQNQDIHFFAGLNFQKEIFIGAKNNLLTLRFSDNPICEIIVDRQAEDNEWNFISRGLYKTDSTMYALASNQGMLIKNLITGEEKLVQFFNTTTKQPLIFDCLRTIEVDSLGRLWFSTCEDMEGSDASHLIVYNPESQKSTVIPIDYSISAIQMGVDSQLWVANVVNDFSQRLTRFDVQQQKVISSQEIAVNIGKINDIHLLSADSFLLATDLGLFRYSYSSNEIVSIPLLPNPQIQSTIFSIFLFDDKYFLAGREGLFIYTPGHPEVLHYTMDNGLRNNIITAVFREKENKYWLGTFYGISLLNLDENLVLNYSTRDGLPENEFNLHSYFQDETGFYLGYPNGVIRLNLRDSMVGYFSDFELDHALVFNRELEKPDIIFPLNNHLKIPPDVTYFKLFPSSYASYFIDNYYFKLINTALKDTILFSAQNGMIVSNLDAGAYEYKLKTYDRYGNVISGEKLFTISINQHIYQMAWFRILVLLLANILIGSLIYVWIRNRSRQKRKANDLVKRLSELELQVLQAQLNPHFIFNTISAIQYYIQDHDEERADMYLTSFSRLMRMYLDSSKSSYIPLNTEIALLTNYLELEIMVADGDIQSHYEIDPNLDLENIVIPTMILQPFVENAVQHGLFHKTGMGNIYLRFFQIPGCTLHCEIEDDGIGRKQADLINKNKPQKPASRALQIINEKLEVLKATQGLDIEIEIIDKFHEGLPMGTLVQIKFPVIKREEVNSLVSL